MTNYCSDLLFHTKAMGFSLFYQRSADQFNIRMVFLVGDIKGKATYFSIIIRLDQPVNLFTRN